MLTGHRFPGLSVSCRRGLESRWSRWAESGLELEHIIERSPVLRNGEILTVYTPRSHSLSSSTIVTVATSHKRYCLRVSRGKVNYANEKDNIDYLRYKGMDDERLPHIIEVGKYRDIEYSVMPFYRGISTRSNVIARKAVRKLTERRLYQSLALDLVELASKTVSSNTLCFEESVESAISEYLDESDSKEAEDFLLRAIEVIEPAWETIPVIFEHDDFQIGNIIITKVFQLEYKIIDWESGTRHGFPGVDLYNLLESRRMRKSRIVSMLSCYCEKLGVDFAVISYLIAARLICIRRDWKTTGLLSLSEWKRRDMGIASTIRKLMSLA